MTDKEIITCNAKELSNLLEEFSVFKEERNKIISGLRKEVQGLKEKLSNTVLS